jgi:two-component system sensor histidine kinase/response regulator
MTHPTDEDTRVILAVDDSPANLLALEAVFEPLGHRIVTARSGEEALVRLTQHEVVLILMDVHMPGLDGYQTTALIRQREAWRDIPVLFLTAVYNQPEHTHRGYALGAVDYIAKPFDPEVLRGKVRALVLLYTRGQRAERRRSKEHERVRDLFLGAVGHDLRSPLNAINLATQIMLLEPDCGNAHHKQSVERIARAGKRMHRMIEDILDLTRTELAGGIHITPRDADLGEICRTVIEEHRLARPERVVRLDVAGDVRGCWDADRLARVVSNLVGNAIEHQPGPVHVRVKDLDGKVVLEVHNEGPPIDIRVLPALFEPFRRGEEGGAEGLGLGLYIVREIARAHEGSVDATSSCEGTTFTVTLPKSVAAR